MNLRVALVRAEDRHNLSDQIRELESHANYPFGEDSFHIDHGTDLGWSTITACLIESA